MQFRTLTTRRLIGTAAIACAAALIPVAALAATATAPAANASTPACTTSGLVVWINTQATHYTGGALYTLEFTNLSGHACTLHGTPGVSAVILSGRQIGVPANGNYTHTRKVPRRQPRPRGHRDRAAEHHPPAVPPQPALPPGHRGRAAGLPAQPDRIQGHPLPVRGMLGHGALHVRGSRAEELTTPITRHKGSPAYYPGQGARCLAPPARHRTKPSQESAKPKKAGAT
jgi:Protein of unknown function (DUF4232)